LSLTTISSAPLEVEPLKFTCPYFSVANTMNIMNLIVEVEAAKVWQTTAGREERCVFAVR